MKTKTEQTTYSEYFISGNHPVTGEIHTKVFTDLTLARNFVRELREEGYKVESKTKLKSAILAA